MSNADRSSSCSQRDAGFRSFLRRSLAAIRAEAPAAYGRLAELLAPREVLLAVDGESVALRFSAGDVRELSRPEHPAVEFRTSRDTILDLIDARCSLLGAARDDRCLLRAAPGDLVAFHDGLIAYLHGAVRSFSMPELLAEFRAGGRRAIPSEVP